MKLFIIFTSNSLTETIYTISDRWREFLCLFGRKEPDVRNSRDRKIEHFEFTPVDHILSIILNLGIIKT